MKDLEQELTESLGQSMQKTIDFDILCDTLSAFGWTVVEIGLYQGDGDIARSWMNVVEWADKNCTGEWQEHLGKWLFERPEDAMLFKLRWA